MNKSQKSRTVWQLVLCMVMMGVYGGFGPSSLSWAQQEQGSEAGSPSSPSASPPGSGSAGGEQNRNGRGFDRIESGRELVNIDFPELTDIKDIIKAVSTWTGKNVILDRNVSGKVQIIAPKAVTKVEAYEAFKSALNVLNLTPVETGKFLKIMPIRSALRDNLKTYYGDSYSPNTDQVITQVVPLKFVDAKAVRSMLSKVVSANSLIAYEPTNTLIISEAGYKINRVLEIIKYLDVETEQSQVAIVPIIYSDAKHIASQVKQIFTGKSSARSSSYHTYKIFADANTNSVVIFGPPRTIKDVRDLVKKFDIKVEDVSRQAAIRVRPLDYADAKKLAATLNALTQQGTSNNRSSRLSSTLSRLRNAANRSSGRSSSSSDQPSVADLGAGVKITADESSNSLLITGSRTAYNAINAIIRKMDVKKSQVFIEADILDISLKNGFNFGTSGIGGIPSSILGEDAQVFGQPVAAASTWQPQTIGPLALGDPQGAVGTLASNFTFGILAGKKLSVPGIGDITPGVLIQMIKTDGNSRVLSSPQILISNNEKGEFSSGRKLFFETSSVNQATGAALPKVESEEVKMQLKITPNISYSDYVTLNLEMHADSLAGTDPKSNLPIISKRKTQQSLTVKNAQTVVISGLVDTIENESYQKIPLLGDLPLLGWLFRNSEIRKEKTNLVIFLTVHIIHGPNDLARIYQQKLEERDKMLERWTLDMLGNPREDEFYASLPGPEDGKFRPTEVDVMEERRLKELRDQLFRDMGYYEEAEGEKRGVRQEVITTVPHMPEGSGESFVDEDGGMGEEGATEVEGLELEEENGPSEETKEDNE